MGLTQWRRLEVICLYLITFVFKYLSFHLCNWLLKLKKEVLVSQLEELTSAQCKRPSLLGAFSGATISTSVSTVDCENPTVACNSPTSPTNLLHGGLDSDFSAGAGAGAGVEMRPGENGSSDCTGTSVHASARSFGVKCASSKARTTEYLSDLFVMFAIGSRSCWPKFFKYIPRATRRSRSRTKSG